MRRLLFIITLIISIVSCDPSDSHNNTQGFDRGTFLIYYADAHIQPAFDSLSKAALVLQQQWNQLPQEIEIDQLKDLQHSWKTLFIHWQSASIFNLGPAAEQGFRKSFAQELGTFPISLSKMNALVDKNDTSFANFDRDTRGIFALEYLLFGGSDTNALNLLKDNNARTYCNALMRQISQETQRISTEWKSYRKMFVEQTATDAGSSTVQLFNSFLLAYEGLKNFKLGVPLGLRMGQTQIEPEKVEALYSHLGKLGIQTQMKALESVWRGDGKTGFRAYLLASTGGAELVQATEAQLRVIESKIDLIPDEPLHDMVRIQHPSLIELHTELQRNTRFFKSDMSSILGLSITYSSGDGD